MIGQIKPFNLVTDYLITKLQISEDAKYEVLEISANELIKANRLDLIAKYMYILFKEQDIRSNFATEVYTKHLEAFSKGSFKEPGNDNKNSLEDYITVFDEMIDDIKFYGFDERISYIPVGNDMGILDGAHRVSSAAYFNQTVKAVKFRDIPSSNYNYEYFRNALLDEKYLDFMVQNYCKLKKDIYVACLWPSAASQSKRDQAFELIKKTSKVIYWKNINLTYNGLRNLMIQIYGHQDWIGNYSNHYSGVNRKVDYCYGEGKFTIIILENDDFEIILKLKEDIRNIFKLDKHSIHITDTDREAAQVVDLLLNENSVNHLNNGLPDKYPNTIKDILKIKSKNEHTESVIMCPNATLAVYGIEDVGGIFQMDKSLSSDEITKITQKYDFLYDTNNFFVYDELKFMSLPIALEYSDIDSDKKKHMIEKYITRDHALRNKRLLKNRIKITIRKKTAKIYDFFIIFLKKVGLFEMARKIYKSIRRESI
ncbi:hypothetical protein [Neobacillus sp. SAB-20_R2A]|uniref:hypothetical protein n=1 Tax=Neobacillus sp. SAB-20_R2A TaxID=3120519 RepID=UPI003C6E2B5F